MSEYERSLVIEAAPETVFDIVSHAKNSPIFMQPAYRLEAQSQNEKQAPHEWMRIHPGEYLMEWGSGGDSSYSGWLQIEELDDASEITMHLSFPSRLNVGADAVEQDLLTAMQAMKIQAERHTPNPATLSP